MFHVAVERNNMWSESQTKFEDPVHFAISCIIHPNCAQPLPVQSTYHSRDNLKYRVSKFDIFCFSLRHDSVLPTPFPSSILTQYFFVRTRGKDCLYIHLKMPIDLLSLSSSHTLSRLICSLESAYSLVPDSNRLPPSHNRMISRSARTHLMFCLGEEAREDSRPSRLPENRAVRSRAACARIER